MSIQPIMTNKKLSLWRTSLLLSLLLLSIVSAHGHNKIVVIPMAGDDVPAQLTPSMPVTKTDPGVSDYTINELTVTDNITQLEWQRSDDNITRIWAESLGYCSDLILDGHQDWRLPSVKELNSIVDYGSVTVPQINLIVFTSTNAARYWSASLGGSNSAWDVDFNGGRISRVPNFIFSYARCVR